MNERPQPFKLRLMVAILFAVFIGVGFYFRHKTDTQIESLLNGLPYRCPLRWWTGLKCAFCGMTHSWIFMFRGDFEQAWNSNQLGPIMWVLYLAVSLAMILGWKPLKKGVDPRVSLALLFVLIAYAIIRNFN